MVQEIRTQMNWVALFSHSGAELSEVLHAFPGRTPLVATNRPLRTGKEMQAHGVALNMQSNLIFESLRMEQHPTLVTLHGFNRILPPDIVNKPNFEIYNVHPGDTVDYPELRGIDPQRKALQLGLKKTGVIIHLVTNNLDDGPIVEREVVEILPGETEDSLIQRMRRVSIRLWISFLTRRGV